MSLTVTISGSSVTVGTSGISIENSIDERSTATFTVFDSTGTAHYTRGQPVVITDSTLGTLFSGIITDSTETRLVPSTTIASQISASDYRYFSDNHIFTIAEYTNTYSGDIVADLVDTYLTQDGITANAAVDHDNSQTTFSTGTLTGTVATTADLELSAAGTTYTKTESSTADFATGTLTNVTAANNSLVLSSTSAMKYVGSAAPNVASNAFVYTKIASPSLTINSGDIFIYEVFVSSTSPVISCGLDLVFTDGTTLRDANMGDQNGINAHPSTDLSNYAKDQWYHREIGLNDPNTSFAGKTVSYVMIGFEGDSSGTYTAYVRNAKIVTSGYTTRSTIFSSTLSNHQRMQVEAYYSISLSVVTAYNHIGQRVSPAYNYGAAGIVKDSLITWTQPTYTQTTSNAQSYPPSLLIETSIDGGDTWQTCTNHAVIPDLLAGMTATSRTITIRQTLALAGPDPEITPMLSDCTITVAPSYTATKVDAISSNATSSDFATGTLTNVSYSSTNGGEQITGVFDSWATAGTAATRANGTVVGQTTFGTSGGNPVVSVLQGQCELRCGLPSPPAFVSSRFDFAGSTWQNFVLECDVMYGDVSVQSFPNIIYRTTGWQNVDYTFAYAVQLTQTTLQLIKGTNTSSGGGTQTVLATSGAITVQSAVYYHLRIVVNGNSHQVYLNDIQYLNVTDSSWTGAGYVGLKLYNNNSLRQSVYFANFGIMSSSFVGTRVHPSLSLNALGSVQNSLVQWNATVPDNTTLLIESSIDGGSTYQTCTSGAVIPQLTPGTSVTGKSLLIRETLTTQNANATPLLSGISAIVIGNYTATGNRVSPALSLSSVGRCGSSSVSWNAVTPTNTTLTIQTSPNGSSWTTVAASGNAISGLTSQPDPTVDSFSSNTSANYTSTHGTGGGTSTWTYDTTNSRITATGGGNGLFLLNALTGIGDVDMSIDMDESDAGGIAWHYQSASNYYFITVDDSSSTSTQNVITLLKMASGTTSQLAQTAIVFTRGTYHRIRVTMISAVITVYFDGVQALTYTDGSPLAAGQVALSSDFGTARFYQFWTEPQGTVLTGLSNYTKVIMTSTDPTVTPQLLDLRASVRGQTIDTGSLQTLTSYQYQNTISSVFDDLAQKSDYWWGISGGQVYFQNRPAILSPFILQSSDLLAGHSVSLKNTSPYYRNRQYVLGGFDTTILITDTRMGDGFTQAWTLAYSVNTVTPSAPAPTVTINGIAATVGVSGVDTGKDFYYAAASNVIAQDTSETPLSSTDTLVMSYYGQIPVVAVANNTAQQSALAAIQGGTGIVEAIETEAGTDSVGATAIANARLAQYAILSRNFTFTTLRSGLAPGQLLVAFIPEHGIADGQFLLTKVKISAMMQASGAVLYEYDIEGTDGPNLGSWCKFFVALGQSIPT